MPVEKTKLRFASSWDDGHPLDVRIIDLLKKYKLPGTFYLPGADWNSESIKMYDGFEIGAHTLSHPPDLKLLGDDVLRLEIETNKLCLESATGKKITKFCYPRGRYDKRAIKILKELGFESARTTVVLEESSIDPLQTDTAIHVFQRSEYGIYDWLEMASSMVQRTIRQNGIFHIWGHSWEIEKNQNWDKLDKFFDWLTENYEIV